MIIEELWKDVEGYEGFYQVSFTGKVRSKNREVANWGNGTRNIKGKRLVSYIGKRGYPVVDLWKGGKRKMCTVHRLMAQVFLKNPEEKKCINHKDGDKTNNLLDNLEWATHSENIIHAYENGLR